MKKYSFNSINSSVNTEDNALHIYMNNVYGWMSFGLLLTSIIAWYTTKIPLLLKLILENRLFIITILCLQLVIVLTLSNMINKLTTHTATILFIMYSILTGLTMSTIFIVYTYSSIASTFLSTSIMFGIMSIWGYFYKKDLTKIGNIALTLLTGIIISTIINIWLNNKFLMWIISYIGIIIFCILIAWDTQKLKEIGNNILIEHNEQLKRYSILGALMLYLDFINLYILLLRIIGIKLNNSNNEKD